MLYTPLYTSRGVVSFFFKRTLSTYLPNTSVEGFTRSIYCKPQMREVIRNGEVVKIPTGLVDQTGAPEIDKFTAFMAKLTYKHDLTLESLAHWAHDRLKERNRLRQIISNETIQHLGVDLAVAHMICAIGGRVKFVDNPKWYFRYARLDPGLPMSYCGDLHLESVDLSGTTVVYEGFELLPQLTHLRHLRLRRCVHVDDFCMSRVARVSTIELLDIGECPRLTSKGVATLTPLKNLRHLFIHGNPLMEDKELVCLLLEDHLPKLLIEGVNYLEALPEASRRKICALIADEQTKETRVLVTENEQSDSDTNNPPELMSERSRM